MKKLLLFLFLLFPSICFGALSATTNWEQNASATANNVNGGGFNYGNANFLTDGAWTSANTTAPVLTSATYTFTAADVGAWIYSKTTTNVGFYKITAVNAGAATVNATIGQAEILDATTNLWKPSTVVGVDSSASVSSKTFGVDYSRLTTAIVNGVADFNAVGASTTLTSATAGFTPVMPGNIFHQTTTGTGGFGTLTWHEIVSYTNATTVVLDRAPNGGTASVNTTGYIGGAMSSNSTLDDDFAEIIIGGNNVFYKFGTFIPGEAISVASTACTLTAICNYIGYNTVRGDDPTGSSMPTFSQGAVAITLGAFQFLKNFNAIGTATNVFTIGSGAYVENMDILNTSTTVDRGALSSGSEVVVADCDLVSTSGRALLLGNNGRAIGNRIHDSDTGIYAASGRHVVERNLILYNKTAGINFPNDTVCTLSNNTIYGSEAKIGTGILLGATTSNCYPNNNSISGLATGITQTTAPLTSNQGMYNNFYNNTADVSNYYKDHTDTAFNPTFTNVSQLTGTTATTSGSTLTDSGASFNGNVTDNQDFLRVTSGTGVTVGIFPITAHTNTTLTVTNTLGTSSAGDVVYTIPNKHNFAQTGLKAKGFPGAFQGGLTTGHNDIGAVQSQGSTGGSSGVIIL